MNKFRRKFIFFSLWVSGTFPFLFFNCTDINHSDPQIGGDLIIAVGADFDSFNELNTADSDALQIIENMLFMSLVKLDENLQFVPYLAKKWEVKESENKIIFHLKENVFWTDGIQTTAEDVLFTYHMAIHPEVAYPAASRFDLIEAVEILDTLKIQFILKKFYPDVFFDLQMPILPKHILKQYKPKEIIQSPFNRNPVGNGAFKLKEWKANQHVIFEANDNFIYGKPHLKHVIFSIIPEPNIMLSQLKSRSIHFSSNLIPQDLDMFKNEKHLKITRFDGRGYSFIAWNCNRSYLNAKIRYALSHAINRNEIINTLFSRYGIPASGPLMPFVWAYNDNLEKDLYDPQKAKLLLKKEGWQDTNNDGLLDKNNSPFKITLKTNTGSQSRNDMAVLIQAQLKQIGIDVQIDIVEFNLLVDQVFEKKDFDGLLLGWDTDFSVNPTDLYHSDAIENGYNFVSYTNTKVDQLLESGRATIDRKKAKPIWDEFQEIIVEESPYTFLVIQDKIAGYDNRIQNVKLDVRGYLSNINEWWLKNE